MICSHDCSYYTYIETKWRFIFICPNGSFSYFAKSEITPSRFRWHLKSIASKRSDDNPEKPLVQIHSTPKESIHFEFRWVSTQNLHHVGPLIGCPSKLLGVQLRLHFEYLLGNKVYTFFWSRVYLRGVKNKPSLSWDGDISYDTLYIKIIKWIKRFPSFLPHD